MNPMWHDALEWAERRRPGEKVDVGDVEQEVFDRAPFILYRHERFQGLWSLCMPRSVGNQIFVVLSGLAPILGGLALAGNVQFRNIQSQGLPTEVAVQAVMVCFLTGFACLSLGVAGWWRVGRRTRESDVILSGLLLVGSAVTLALAALNDSVEVTDFHIWPTWAALVLAVTAVLLFVLGNSSRSLPDVDISRLPDSEVQILLEQRNEALKEAAKRRSVRLRTVNKAVDKPLGALIARRRD